MSASPRDRLKMRRRENPVNEGEARQRPHASASTTPEIDAGAIWSEPLDRLMVQLGTAPAGLRASEAVRRLAIYGPNDPTITKRTPPWLQFLARFRNPLVIILLVASALSAAAGDLTSFIIVVTIIGISTTLDFLQEFRAHNAVDALRRSATLRTKLCRGGPRKSVSVDARVPRDRGVLL